MKMRLAMFMRKVLRDLRETKARTIGTIVILALGGFAIGTMAVSLFIIQTGIDEGYQLTNPAQIVLRTPPAPAQDEYRRMTSLIASVPGVTSFQRRPLITGRIRQNGNEWKTLNLYIVENNFAKGVDAVTIESGILADKGIGVERAALKFLGAKEGDTVEINIPGMPRKEFLISATVHAPGLAPAWMERTVYVFVDRNAAPWKDLTFREEIWLIRLDPAANPAGTAKTISGLLLNEGIAPVAWEAPDVRRHPHASQMDTLLLMLESFSLLCFLLSVTLGAVQINQTLAAHARQIAVQRAGGCRKRRLWASYFLYVGIMAVGALGVSIPLSLIAGSAYASFALNLLNFNVLSKGIPLWLYGLLAGAGLLLPLLAAWFPIRQAMRRSIREGLQEQGVTDVSRRPIALPIGMRGRYAVRTAARKPLRAFFTVLLLSLGGACFLTAANMQASMDATVQRQFSGISYDSMIVLSAGLEKSAIVLLAALPGMGLIEGWKAEYCPVQKNCGDWTDPLRIFSIPGNSQMKKPPEISGGTWLQKDRPDAIVANQIALQVMGNPAIGDIITLQQGKTLKKYVLAGTVTELMSPPLLYVSGNVADPVNLLVIAGSKHDAEYIAGLESDLENHLPEGVKIRMTMTTQVFKQAVIEHLWVLSAFLLFVSILVLVVGGLSLSSSLAMTVTERSREWAILRSSGAGPRSIYAILLWEGIAYGVISALAGFGASLPVGFFLSRLFGQSFFYAPLIFGLSVPGLAGWAIFLLFICTVSSLFPAMRIIRKPIVDGLQYE